MGFQQVGFDFPHEAEEQIDIEVESSSAEELDLQDAPQKASKKAKTETEEVEVIQEDDVEVEVVDDTPKKDRGRKPSEPPEEVTEDELENYSDKVRKRIQHFSKGYHDERRAKEQALRERQELERMAQQLVEENKRLKGDNNKSRGALLEQAKRAASTELAQAKVKYKQAYEAGDADAVLEAQEALTNAKIKSDKLDNFKLPSLQEEESQLQVNQNVDTAPVAEPQPRVDERASTWAEQNTWFGTDDEMTAYALGLHNKLVKGGMNPTSDEYYETINSRMRTVFPDQFEMDEGEPEERPARKASNVVAPATRSTAPKQVRLKRSQVALAKRLGIPLSEYAKYDAALKRNG